MNEAICAVNDYIVIVVLGICLCIGYVLKNLVENEKINKFIPMIMAVTGLILNIWINQWNVTPEIVLGGLISGLSSTGLYEAFNQFIKQKKNNENKSK